MQYNELRKQYTNFYYHSYEVEELDDAYRFTYYLEAEGLSAFTPTFTIPKPNHIPSHINTDLVQQAAFSLGMVELISYWKIACPKHVIVECAQLDAYQIAWWKKLYFYGLGEFFYTNGIPLDAEGFMDLTSSGTNQQFPHYETNVKGNLIPVGGGKDSFVTLDILSAFKQDNCAFIINPVISAVNSAHAAGYKEGKDLIITKRTLDARMLELNKQGYLNGHTPFSAMAAFASYLTALIYERKYITLSNEASANESTIKGSSVNHQYSKTYAFEMDFYEYTKRYLTTDIQYFSLLRPLSELQIAGLFSKLDAYLPVFRSCNVGSKKGEWCGHCAKCLFVYCMLSAYLPDNKLVDIFQTDMLNDVSMKALFEQLTGILDDKPFECVGTRDEVNIAVCMSIRHHEQENTPLPFLYAYYKTTKYYTVYRDMQVDMLAYNTENNLPKQYEEIVKRKIGECNV